VGIYELLEMDDQIRSLVNTGAGETEFRQDLSLRGYRNLNQEGIRLVDEGTTSIREYIRTMFDAR
jgi:type II secretory ATPase GspE/PulE/Tfp pilus assembly ATPase PilB-like protein